MNSPVIREGVSGYKVNCVQGRDSLWGETEGSSRTRAGLTCVRGIALLQMSSVLALSLA